MTRRQAAIQTALATMFGWIVVVAVLKALNWVFDGDPLLWFIFITLPIAAGTVAYVLDALTEKPAK